jgi:ketosteroid isomerase-like protein
MTPDSHAALVRAYLAAIEAGAVGEELGRYFTEDAVQVEYPNRLNPHGGTSDRATIMARSVQGQHLLAAQHYRVLNLLAEGDRVAVEAVWTGMLAVPLGTLAAGDQMTAHFAMFFLLRDGRIARQHNYDCFAPW